MRTTSQFVAVIAAAALMGLPSGNAAAQQGALPFPLETRGAGALQFDPIALGLDGAGDELGAKAQPVTIFLPQDLVLDPITADEILGFSATAFDAGTEQLIATGFTATSSLNPVAPTFGTVIRELDDLWFGWFRVQDTPGLDVQYEVRGAAGQLGYLTSVAGSASRIRVTSQPRPLYLVEKFRNFRLIQGGVRLRLSFEDIQEAGDYTGSIVIVFNNL